MAVGGPPEGTVDRPEPAKPRVRWSRLLPVAIVLLTAVVVLIYTESLKSRAEVVPLNPAANAATGPAIKRAPDFTLPDLDGRPVTLSAFRGRKVVFLNFWTTWCDACREETFALETFYRRYRDRVAQFGINLQEPPDVIRAFNDAFGVTYPVLLDARRQVADLYRLQAVPESWFIDLVGVARVHRIGSMTFEQMQAAYEQTTGRPIDAEGIGPVTAGRALAAVAWSSRSSGSSASARTVWLTAGELFAWDAATGRWQTLTLPGHAGEAIEDLAAGAGATFVLSASGRVWKLEPLDGDGEDPVVEPVAVGRVGASGDGRAAALAVDPFDGDHLLAWIDGSGAWASGDGGSTWMQVATLPAGTIFSLAFDPAVPGRVLAGAPGAVLESTDGGRTWQRLVLSAENPDPEGRMPWDERFPRPVYDVAFSPGRTGTVYYATNQGIWAGSEGGRFLRFLAGSPARILRSLAVISVDGVDRLLAGAPDGDLYVSVDGGESWRRLGP